MVAADDDDQSTAPAVHPDARACAVCGMVLQRLTAVSETGDDQIEFTVGFEHTLAAKRDGFDDHPVVPVEYSEIRVREKCDFCYAEESDWVLPVGDFEMIGPNEMGPAQMNAGSWAVCGDCADLIRVNDWNKLSYRSWRISGLPRAILEPTAALHRKVRQHCTGPLVRLVTPPAA